MRGHSSWACVGFASWDERKYGYLRAAAERFSVGEGRGSFSFSKLPREVVAVVEADFECDLRDGKARIPQEPHGSLEAELDEVLEWREACGFGECADEVTAGLARHFDEIFELPVSGAVLLHAADDLTDAEEGG